MTVSNKKRSFADLTDANRSRYLAAPVDQSGSDHLNGAVDAKITLVEYGSYASFASSAAHEVVASLHTRFGDQMLYVFRHLPVAESKISRNAAVMSEYAALQSINFWDIHNELMSQGKDLDDESLRSLVKQFGIDPPGRDDSKWIEAEKKVDRDIETGHSSGAFIPPTFFINGRRYEGPWDENSLAEAMMETPGHRLKRATIDFVRWGPSSGIALLTMVIVAFALANSPVGDKFEALWQTPFGFQIGNETFELSLLKWINDGLRTSHRHIAGDNFSAPARFQESVLQCRSSLLRWHLIRMISQLPKLLYS